MHQPKKHNFPIRDNLIVLGKPPEKQSMLASTGLDRLRFIGVASGFTQTEMIAFGADPEGFLDRNMPGYNITYREDPFVIDALVRAEDIFGKPEPSDEAEWSDAAHSLPSSLIHARRHHGVPPHLRWRLSVRHQLRRSHRGTGRRLQTTCFLPYNTLELKFGKGCPADVKEWITLDAARIQSMRGQQYPISQTGQTVLLGR